MTPNKFTVLSLDPENRSEPVMDGEVIEILPAVLYLGITICARGPLLDKFKKSSRKLGVK